MFPNLEALGSACGVKITDFEHKVPFSLSILEGTGFQYRLSEKVI